MRNNFSTALKLQTFYLQKNTFSVLDFSGFFLSKQKYLFMYIQKEAL